MAATIDIKIKQDSIHLKQLGTAPDTGLGEAVLFLDSFDKQIKVRAENNGAVTGLSSSGGSEITRESLGAAKSGVNTDITSLGSPTSTTLVNGNLSLPEYSIFTAYHPIDQILTFAQLYNKVNLETKGLDKLNEYADSRFTATRSGIYLFSGAVSTTIDIARADWRIILSFYVNGTEASRGNDLTIPVLYGGTSGTAILPLNAGDYVELFLYSQYTCTIFGGEGYTRMSGIRLA